MANTGEAKKVLCGTHGYVLPAYVCQHLAQDATTPAGFIEPDLDENDTDLQAWCSACDAVLEREGWEWTPVAEEFANIRLVCEFCFAKLRQIHGAGP